MNILIGVGVIAICVIAGSFWLWLATVKVNENCPRD